MLFEASPPSRSIFIRQFMLAMSVTRSAVER
jgi:hypothetical protein